MTIHSYDGNTGLTKLERISELSAQQKERVFNNIGHHINRELLREMYHRLDGNKAMGIDGKSKADYGKQLEENLTALIGRIRRGTYRPQAARIVQIPKEDGSTRPLAIACVEDKLVQSATNALLTAIYEPLFEPCSYGFRPGKNCHDALRALSKSTYKFWQGAVVEIDLHKYFNTIPHSMLLNCLGRKISDKRFLNLLVCLLRTPILIDGEVVANEIGCPQGSIVSPILANIYLHEVVDIWFKECRELHFKGKAEMVRYCDDMVFIFQRQDDAKRFYNVLPKRLGKYGLNLHREKSQLIPSGHIMAVQADKRGERLPTYPFLGFTCYFGRTRNGYWRLKYTSRKERFSAKLKGLRKFLWQKLNTQDTVGIIKTVVRIVRGWINYHGISDNERRVKGFIVRSERILFSWINRRGRKHPLNWMKFSRLLELVGYPKRWKVVSML